MYSFWQYLGGNAAPHYFTEETDSTMYDAILAVEARARHGTVLQARWQSAGIGRVEGRKWYSNPGENLLLSVCLEKKKLGVNFPLSGHLLALASCVMMEKIHGIQAEIKWPNDVLLKGKKIAGLVGAVQGSYLVLGIGINIAQEVFPEGLLFPASSLKLAGVHTLTPTEYIAPLWSEFMGLVSGQEWHGAYEARLWSKNSTKPFRANRDTADEQLIYIEGVEIDGRLRARDEDGKKLLFSSGEFAGA